MKNKTHLKRIASVLFTYELHEMNNSRYESHTPLGYCEGMSLQVLPKQNTVAVMYEDEDFEKYWIHLPKGLAKSKYTFEEELAEEVKQTL